jgi:hypothetical protein
LVTGGATTSAVPEGSNLYWTQARFNTALAAVSGAVSGICPLDSTSLIPAAYLPAVTVRNTFTVSSQAAMLALGAHQGDVAIRTDVNETFILTNNVPATLGNWAQVLAPPSAVASVNGVSGTITLTTSNIAEGSNLYFTTARGQAAALSAVLTGFTNATGGEVTSGDTILIALGRLENRMEINDAKVDGSTRVLRAGDTMTGTLGFSGSTNGGLILSSLTDTQRAALTPANGMVIYNTTLSQMMLYNGSWQSLAVGGGSTWFNGTGAPASTLGVNGNYYMDTAGDNIYLKTAGTWSIVFTGSSSGSITVTANQLIGSGSAPTISGVSGTGAAANLTLDASPTGLAMRIAFQTGSSPASGTLFSVSFPTAYAKAPKVVAACTGAWTGTIASPGTIVAIPVNVIVDYATISTTGFSCVSWNTSLTANQVYFFDVIVVG